jgi:hypothetical protein
MYTTWHNYGYGIQTDNLNTDKTRLCALIDTSPEVKGEILSLLRPGTKPEDYDYDNLLSIIEECDYNNDNDDIIAGLLTQVIYINEDLPVEYVTDFDDNNFVILPKVYPWQTTDTMKALTSEDDITALFAKYISILTDQNLDELDYGWHEIENYG